MAIKSAPYYWVECDGCGARHEDGEYSAWGDPGSAVDYAIGSDWTEKDGVHHCPACPSLHEEEYE